MVDCVGFFRGSKYVKITSRGTPCVSGNINIQNNELKMENEVNIVQTFSTPKVDTIKGYILMIVNIKAYPHV